MIQSISSWAGNIIVAVIIATILEMVIIEGNNKKYIKAIIGLYLVFTIISPVIKTFSSKEFELNNIAVEDFIGVGGKGIEIASSNNLELNNSNNINKIYNSSLEADIRARVAEKGFTTKQINLNIDEEEKTIKSLILTIEKNTNDNLNENSKNKDTIQIEPIKQIGIQPINKNNNKSQETSESDTSNNVYSLEVEELRSYLSSTYEVHKQNITINLGG